CARVSVEWLNLDYW
nr:immunoglobulin heavy chain junction region [Macaca mulatta]MOW91045.1 immunoglobulin heavy chain junction region [Macaca mulatta]MOW92963.1 immunoglobulin heavy chain junction region [Macaca mulatta]